jgi:putative ABC transport system substrate-binding protein
VILAAGTTASEVMLKTNHSIPIVFVVVPDPVGAGYVKRLSQPGGNATGFMMFEYNLCGKWLELLKEIAPSVTHAAVVRDPAVAAGIGQFAVIQSVAPSGRHRGKSNRLTANAIAPVHSNLIIAAAARYKLPAVYVQRPFVTAGGLMSYGPNFADQYRRAASCVDRIFKGEKPADLPVQAPNNYELAINLKTAKALGLSVPQSLLARADAVIE